MLVASKALVVTEATAAEVARDLEEVALSVGSAMVLAAEKKLTAAGGGDWPARSRCTQKLMAWLAIAQLEPCRPWLQLRTACAHAGTASAWMQDRIVETTETASEEPSGICMAAISHIG